MFLQNFIELSVAVYELLFPYLLSVSFHMRDSVK